MNLKNYFTVLFCFCASFVFAQLPPYVPTSGLLAWWGMADATDATTNGNTLSPFNLTPTTDRFGNANSAYTFNGTSSYLTRASFGHTFTQAGSFSVSIWVKKANNTSGNVAIMSGSTASLNFIWLVQCDATKAILEPTNYSLPGFGRMQQLIMYSINGNIMLVFIPETR